MLMAPNLGRARLTLLFIGTVWRIIIEGAIGRAFKILELTGSERPDETGKPQAAQKQRGRPSGPAVRCCRRCLARRTDAPLTYSEVIGRTFRVSGPNIPR